MIRLVVFTLVVASAVTASDECEQENLACAVEWNTNTASETDPFLRCAHARVFRACLDKVILSGCQNVRIPLQLDMEEAVTCHTPENIGLFGTPCSAAQLKCYDAWSAAASGKYVATELCTLAKQWILCLQDTVSNFLCPDLGINRHLAESKLLGNCIGASEDDCVARQDACKDQYKSTTSKTDAEKCQAARAWRECLVETVRDDTCEETITFPSDLDKAEADYCDDYKKRDSCESQAIKCQAQWSSTTSPHMPKKQRCTQALNWISCLQGISETGGCPGGYTLAKEAQVERIMSCHVVYSPDLNECNLQTRNCWVEYEVNRKYLTDKEELCDLVLDTRSCLSDVLKSNICPQDTQEPTELGEAESDFCEARYQAECDKEKAECEKTFDKTIKGETLPSVICEATKDWKQCILDASVGLCTVEYPVKVYTMEVNCFLEDPTTAPPMTECEKRMAACADLYYSDDLSKLSECDRATMWRQCLDGLLSTCKVVYPSELNSIQANNGCV